MGQPRVSRRLTTTVLLVALVALCGSGWLLWHQAQRPERANGGPLHVPPEHGYMFTQAQGTTFTDALQTVTFTGDRPLVLDSVELVGGEGLRLLGFQLAGPDRTVSLDYLPEYPPSEVRKELGTSTIIDGPGAILQPSDDLNGWELLVGIEITEPGPLWRKGLRINYSVDGKKYTAFFPAQIQVCTAPGQKGPAGKCRR